MDIRYCEIESNFNRSIDFKEVVRFHKWFDGCNEFKDVPEQFAIIENEGGFINKISIENYKIRFLSSTEVSDLEKKKALDKFFPKE